MGPAADRRGHRDHRDHKDHRDHSRAADSHGAVVRSPGAGGHSRRVGDIPVVDGPPAGLHTPWEAVVPFLRGEDSDVEEDVLVGAHAAAPHVAAAHTPAAAVHSHNPGAAARSRAAAGRDYHGPAVDSHSRGAGSRAAADSRGAADSRNRRAADSRGADRHLEVDDRRAVDVAVDVRIQPEGHGDLVGIRHV